MPSRRLRAAECVECVVQRELTRHIVEVVAACRLKARRRRIQSSRFRRETSIVSVGASHHPGQRRQCGIRQLVSVDEGIKGALCTVMTELDLWNVIRDRVLSIRDFPNSVRRGEQEFGLRVDTAA